MLNFSENSMDIMQRVQNRAMRAILQCNKYTPIRKMLDALSFMTIKERMLYNVCLFVHKMKCEMTPPYLSKEIKFVKDKHQYNTRQKENIKIKFCKTSAGQKSMTYTGFQLYNKLPEKVRDSKGINEFKKEVSRKK